MGVVLLVVVVLPLSFSLSYSLSPTTLSLPLVTRMYTPSPSLLTSTMHRMYTKHTISSLDASISLKDNQGSIWITPSNNDKSSLSVESISCLSIEGAWSGITPPTSEYILHTTILNQHPTIKSIIHAHSPFLLSFALSNDTPQTLILNHTLAVCSIPQYESYSWPATKQQADKACTLFMNDLSCKAIVLANHGVMVGGESIHDAFSIFETLEFCARVQWAAKSFMLKPLTAPQLEAWKNASYNPTVEITQTIRFISENEKRLRTEIIYLIQRAYSLGLFLASSGSITARLSDSTFICTPHGVDRESMSESDLLYISTTTTSTGVISLNVVHSVHETHGRTPSRALKTHVSVLQHRHRHLVDVDMIVSCHPLYVSVLVSCHESIDTVYEPYLRIGNVEHFPFHAVFTPSMITSSSSSSTTTDNPSTLVWMINNDGCMVLGKGWLDCLNRIEQVEQASTVQVLLKV